MKQRILYLMIFCLTMGAFARGQESADSVGQQEIVIRDSANFVKASLMIAEPYEKYPQSVFGHTFLRLICDEAGLDYCFSIESGDYEGFLDICRGHYPNRLVNVPTEEYLKNFNREGRIVTEYPLNITLQDGQHLWQTLDSVAMAGLLPYHDFFHHGCSQEIIRLLDQGLNGKIVYGQGAERQGKTHFILNRLHLPANSWTRLFLAMYIGTDATDRVLEPSEKVLLPCITASALSDAKVETPEGDQRLLLKEVAPIQHQPQTRFQKSQALPVYLWLTLLFGIVLAISLIRHYRSSRAAIALARTTDTVLFILYNAIALSMLILCIISVMPTFCGWNWNYLIYNPIPLLVWFYDRFRGLSHGCWRKTYLVYACWLCLYMVVMFIVGDHFLLEQYLLTFTFTIRCLFKVKEHRIKD